MGHRNGHQLQSLQQRHQGYISLFYLNAKRPGRSGAWLERLGLTPQMKPISGGLSETVPHNRLFDNIQRSKPKHFPLPMFEASGFSKMPPCSAGNTAIWRIFCIMVEPWWRRGTPTYSRPCGPFFLISFCNRPMDYVSERHFFYLNESDDHLLVGHPFRSQE